jgi:hypothetical protein
VSKVVAKSVAKPKSMEDEMMIAKNNVDDLSDEILKTKI